MSLRGPTCVTLLACGLATGCRSRNPVGFWDIRSIDIETEAGEGSRGDCGTLEWTKSDSITVILRYEVTDPAEAPAADTADADGPTWMAPISPPLRATASGDPKEGFSIHITDTFRVDNLAPSDWAGDTLTLSSDEGTVGTQSGASVRFELQR